MNKIYKPLSPKCNSQQLKVCSLYLTCIYIPFLKLKNHQSLGFFVLFLILHDHFCLDGRTAHEWSIQSQR